MSKKITIIDYGCGNIYSLTRVLNKLGYTVEVTNDSDKIINSDKIILPGVGAFKIGIDNLKKNKLDESINLFLNKGNYLLGICLGMQLLMEKSDEFGSHIGLGLIKGNVTKLNNKEYYPIPHIGWSQIELEESSLKKNSILENIKDRSYFYFIHSFQVKTNLKKETLSFTNYGDNCFSSIINSENIFGTQFHPEKSGKVGERLLSNFLKK